MPAIQSTVSSQYQTTIPQAIRKRLGVGKNDTICYRIVRGAVVMEKAEPLTERLRALHAGIRKKVAAVRPGLTAREARELYAAAQKKPMSGEKESHGA